MCRIIIFKKNTLIYPQLQLIRAESRKKLESGSSADIFLKSKLNIYDIY